MNRQPTREEIQRYLQRWQQLRTQYGDDVVNVPEYTQLTKVIQYIQAQAMQRQQMQQGPQASAQFPQQPAQQRRPPPQAQAQPKQNANYNPNAAYQPQMQQNYQQPFSKQGQKYPQQYVQMNNMSNSDMGAGMDMGMGMGNNMNMGSVNGVNNMSNMAGVNSGNAMGGNAGSTMAPGNVSSGNNMNAMGNVNNMNMANMNMRNSGNMANMPAAGSMNSMGMNLSSSMGGNINSMGDKMDMASNISGTPLTGHASVGPSPTPAMMAGQRHPMSMAGAAHQQKPDYRGGMSSQGQGPLPGETPFTPQQLQLLKSQSEAARLLFKNSGGFSQLPQNVIDTATNERLAFSGNQPQAQTPAMNPMAMRSGMNAQQQAAAAPSPQTRQAQVPLAGATPRSGQIATPQQFPEPTPAAAAARGSQTRVSQLKSASGTPKVPAAVDPNLRQPVVRPAQAPVLHEKLVKAEDLSDQLVLPLSKPGARVDTFVLPKVFDTKKDIQIPFSALYTPQSKMLVPSLLPFGINPNEIISSRESHITLQIDARIGYLEKRLMECTNEEERLEVSTELNQLKLLPHQKEIRGQILSQVWFSKSLLPNSHPNFLAKFPDLSMENVFETEELYKQQLYSFVQAQNKKQQETISNILSFNSTKKTLQASKKERLERLNIKINGYHAQVEKEEQKKIERMAKQRLQALRSNDEEAYLKLLDHTKDTRITHLLNQTNQFLDTLAQAVQTQQRETAASSSHPPEKEEEEEDEKDPEKREKVDYYQVAHRIREEVHRQPSILVGGTLKEYQLKGLQWMVSLYNNHLNGILADEMGLGKTIQTLSLITYLVEFKQVAGPFLVIVPLSTLTNWNIEFEKWAPTLRKITYKGTPVQRKVMQNDVRSGNFEVLLTTFDYIIKDKAVLSKIKWVHMIIDEGHRMKNTNSKLSETLTHFYHSDYRLILTGTPLQNNLPELWALLNFVLPKIFNSVKSFDEWFNTPFANTGGQDKIELSEEETLLVIRRLHKVLRPFLLRRLKKDVEKDLPNKVEKVIKCKMSALQSKLYRMMLKYNVLFAGEAVDGKKPSTIKNANNQLMQLRKICNHPFVYEEVESLINPASDTNDTIWRTAGKFELLDRILPKFKQTGHRVLIFFQMTQIMDIMEDFLRLRGLKYMRLDGATKSDDRSELLKLFNAPNSDYFCFLLSTRAGGLGLNLQSADTVIIFDSDWNPHQDLQAQDRAHRIGQKNEVIILRLITEDSIEEMILDRAAAKLEIDGKVIQAGKFDNKSTSEEQEALLRALMEKEEERRLKAADEDQDMDDDEMNQLIARNPDELDVFRALDDERALETSRASHLSRLYADSELPEFYQKDPQLLYKSEEQLMEEYGRGNRERKTAVYDDNMTEDEWLRRIEGLDDSENENAPRKKGRPKKRREGSPDGHDEETSIKRPKVITPSLRGRKSRAGRPRTKHLSNRNTPTVDILSPEERYKLQERMERIYDAMLNYMDGERKLSDLFLVKPSKKLYPDYYVLIKHPLAFDVIRKRMGNNTYMQIRDFLEDVHLIFSNARTYNEVGSIVYTDAQTLENVAIAKYKEEYADESEEWGKVLDFADFDQVSL